MNGRWKELLNDREAMKKKLQELLKNKKAIYFGIGIIVFVLLIILCLQVTSGKNNYEELLDLGNRYLEEMDYESAIAVFDKAISIEPKDERGYIGKATAQFEYGMIDEAIETLYTGIAMVTDSTRLNELLQQFQESQLSDYQGEDEQWEDPAGNIDLDEQEASSYLILNYTYIARKTNTENAQIQLEVVGNAGPNSHFTWSSTDEQCAVVSEDGLLTCLPQEGYAEICVSDGNKRGYCNVEIFDGAVESETVSIQVPSQDADKEYYISVKVSEEEESGSLADLGSFIYHSGAVEIPEHLSFLGKEISVAKIAYGSLGWNNKMTSFKIPSTVEEFESNGQNPFVNCPELTEILVDEGNESYQSIDGVLFSKDGKELIAYPMNRQEKTFVLPKEVEIIYGEAFIGCSNLEEIQVEDGNEFFEALDGVLVQKADHKLLLYPSAKKDKDYTIPDGIESIASYAFCGSQVENVIIGDSVKQLEYNAFDNCSMLKSLQGMRKVEEIDSSAIAESRQLEMLGGGEATKELSVLYTDKPVKLLNASEMVNLEKISIHIENLKELSWLKEMKNLQSVSFRIDDINSSELSVFTQIDKLSELELVSYMPIDINDLPKLENLQELKVHVKNLQGLSVLGEMERLERLELETDSFENADLSVLMELNNLSYFNAYGTGGSPESLEEETIQQLDMLREKNPDCFINVLGYGNGLY